VATADFRAAVENRDLAALGELLTLAIHRNWAGWCPDSRKVPLTCEDATVEEASDARVRTPFW